METSRSSVVVENVAHTESSSRISVGESLSHTSVSTFSSQERDQTSRVKRKHSAEWLCSLKTCHRRVKCKICNSLATGVHFGVLSCYGCKEAFRRQVLDLTDHVCKNTSEPNTCNMRNVSERRCILCRAKRCAAAGMSVNGVKLRWNSVPNILPLGTPKCLKELTAVFRQIFSDYIRKVNRLFLIPQLLTDRALEIGSPSFKHVMFSEFCQYYEPLVTALMQFTKHIPGFTRLPNDDQMILFKTGFVDAWIIMNSSRLFLFDHCIVLHDNTLIPRSEFSTIYSKPYIQELEKFTKEMALMKLTATEKALMVSIALTVPERANLLKPMRAKHLQKTYYRLAKTVHSLRRPKAKEDYRAKLKALITSVHQLGKQHSLLLNYYRQHPDKLTVNDVIRELFDLYPQQKYQEKEK